MKKSFFIISVIAFLLVGFRSYNGGDAVIKNIRACYASEFKKQDEALKNDKVCYMKYAVKAVSVDSLNVPYSESTIEAWYRKNHIEIKSRDMELYQDEKEVLTILPTKKLILRSDAVIKDSKSQNRILLKFDTLLNYCTVKSQNSVKNSSLTLVELDVNDRGIKMSGVKKIFYYLDLKKQSISKVKIIYAHKNGSLTESIAYAEYDFKVQDYDYKGKKLSDNVSDTFIKRKSKLNQKFSSYKLIDNRAGKRIPQPPKS
jgi:hypothetical protein